MVFTSEYSFKPLSPLKTDNRKCKPPCSFWIRVTGQCLHCWRPLMAQKYCTVLWDKDTSEAEQLWKVSFQNTKSLLVIFGGRAAKPYSQFTSVARHFISSEWTLCAQSVEAVYPGKYTKHWSPLCAWLMRFVMVKRRIILFKAASLQLRPVRLM